MPPGSSVRPRRSQPAAGEPTEAAGAAPPEPPLRTLTIRERATTPVRAAGALPRPSRSRPAWMATGAGGAGPAAAVAAPLVTGVAGVTGCARGARGAATPAPRPQTKSRFAPHRVLSIARIADRAPLYHRGLATVDVAGDRSGGVCAILASAMSAGELLYTAHVPGGEGPFPTLFLLHGWGASPHDLLGLAPLLHGGRALVLCPQGPVVVPIGGGERGYGWVPLPPRPPPGVEGSRDRRGLP